MIRRLTSCVKVLKASDVPTLPRTSASPEGEDEIDFGDDDPLLEPYTQLDADSPSKSSSESRHSILSLFISDVQQASKVRRTQTTSFVASAGCPVSMLKMGKALTWIPNSTIQMHCLLAGCVQAVSSVCLHCTLLANSSQPDIHTLGRLSPSQIPRRSNICS